MEFEPDINSLRDEAFRKIGRNLFNFQKIEHLLKVMIANAQTSGWAHNIEANQIARRDKIAKKTMGLLAEEFFSNTATSCCETDEDQNKEVKEPTFSISIRLENEFHASKRSEIESLINERNELVHHRLCSINADRIVDWQELIVHLDSQRERQRVAYDFLKSLALELADVMQELSQQANNEEFLDQISLLFLSQSPVVQLLIQYAEGQQDNNGWTDLSAAGNTIRQELPGDLEKLKKGWRYQKLPDLLRAFDFFELKPEPLTNGGYRWLYRIIHQGP